MLLLLLVGDRIGQLLCRGCTGFHWIVVVSEHGVSLGSRLLKWSLLVKAWELLTRALIDGRGGRTRHLSLTLDLTDRDVTRL